MYFLYASAAIHSLEARGKSYKMNKTKFRYNILGAVP